MTDDLIENPVINSPYGEPSGHFVFGETGITNREARGRRPSMYFIPVAQPRKHGPQLLLEVEGIAQERRQNDLINRIRDQVGLWRSADYPGVTATTRVLLDHWNDELRDRQLFFCQREAAETAVFLTEIAQRDSSPWLAELRASNREDGGLLQRTAFKIATGGGKTVVMAMLIAWQALNKFANTRDGRFAAAFLVVTPNITIRDRLRSLLPSDADAVYRVMDLVPPRQMEALNRATIIIANYHQMIRRDRNDAARLTKQILTHDGAESPFVETPDAMVARLCRDIPARLRSWGVVVLNDEAHHCYRRRPAQDPGEERLTGDERREVEENARTGEVWISGLEAVARKIGVKAVYDMSATPFYLKGSGRPEGTLFPWVVSDFALIDAIEAGIVKIPRLPVADNRDLGTLPTYRNLWKLVGTQLPKRVAGASRGEAGEPKLPGDLESALRSLYENYAESHATWETTGRGLPPVFIVVCNNTLVSKLVYDWVAGWEKQLSGNGAALVPGALALFSNVEGREWLARPPTILIDSRELESGEPLSSDFKKAAAPEIDRFKDEYGRRYPGRDVEEITDADILREVMNTVGKPDRLGEQVRCVVSVSMLTEGWDANTVTHVLGVRAFTTQLLCEQVVGRALRRYAYVAGDDGRLPPEYAEVYGVPFAFIPTTATKRAPQIPVIPTLVCSLTDREPLAITFPRVIGYRHDVTLGELTAQFTSDSLMPLSTRDVVTETELDPIAGAGSVHDLGDLRARRMQEVAFVIARRLHQDHFRDEHGNDAAWLFPRLLDVTRQWLKTCLRCSDEAFPQLLLIRQQTERAADRIARALVRGSGHDFLRAVLDPEMPTGSTRGLRFETIKRVRDTHKSQLSHVVLDSDWESKLAQVLEEMPEVLAYVKNDRLGFEIPYTFEGRRANYRPDFIARVNDGEEDPLNLVIEVTGERREAKGAKVATAELWVPAVNSLRDVGRWSYLEVSDVAFAMNSIRSHVRELRRPATHA